MDFRFWISSAPTEVNQRPFSIESKAQAKKQDNFMVEKNADMNMNLNTESQQRKLNRMRL